MTLGLQATGRKWAHCGQRSVGSHTRHHQGFNRTKQCEASHRFSPEEFLKKGQRHWMMRRTGLWGGQSVVLTPTVHLPSWCFLRFIILTIELICSQSNLVRWASKTKSPTPDVVIEPQTWFYESFIAPVAYMHLNFIYLHLQKIKINE